ncbi:hypothetical protein DOTSEDRAFT_76034 [Dothistroma septosporum NZE10]|uniref:Uncharacterized protein n=1 Tax=Dothistroma septosporum (strain NZE10 / CBS 128990) TaxID=675120 RepID=N1PZD4_DOTSN|nr:hypothetical protein DOTSEDRAFT_76034 [Dothistroma septosporum NZE10]
MIHLGFCLARGPWHWARHVTLNFGPKTRQSSSAAAAHDHIPFPTRRLYTAQDDETILQRRIEAISFPKIAHELGRTDSSVRARYWSYIAHTHPSAPRKFPARNKYRFTANDDDLVVRMHGEGQSGANIAAAVRTTPGVISRRIYGQLGARLRSGPRVVSKLFTPQDDATILKLRAKGHTFKEISEHIDRSRCTVITRHIRLVQPSKTPRKVWTTAETVDLLKLHDSGLSISQVSTRLNRTRQSTRQKLQALATQTGNQLAPERRT